MTGAAATAQRCEGFTLLAPGYGWFTEGFETLDLREAKALLNELASEVSRHPATFKQPAYMSEHGDILAVNAGYYEAFASADLEKMSRIWADWMVSAYRSFGNPAILTSTYLAIRTVSSPTTP